MQPLFDFNPFSMSFPALCLRILPAPPTLFSATPFAHAESWTLGPPGEEQFNSLIQAIHDLIRQKRASHTQLPNDCSVQQILENDPEARRTLDHVQNAYNHWKSLSKAQHSEAWTLETLRAFSRVHDDAAETAASLDQARKEIEHLRHENDKLSRCQQPREFTLHPPTLLPISSEAAKVLSTNNASPRESAALWDFDRLMEKWRRIIRESRRGMDAQRSFVDSPSAQPSSTTPFGQQQQQQQQQQPQPQPPTPSPQPTQPQPQGLATTQATNANGLGMAYLRPATHGHHANGTGTNGTSHASTPNALAPSPRPDLMDGQADGAGVVGVGGDVAMGNGVDEEDDRDADGEADVDIEDAPGQNGEVGGQQSWNGQQQQQQQSRQRHQSSTNAGDTGPGDMDRRFLDPKLERASSAGAQGMEGMDGAHFMDS